jgi:3-oxoacyl-[acyl-carrier-protein] synthase-1
MSERIVITAVQCMTPLGLDATSTAVAVRAGISALRMSDQFDDTQGEPILEACIPWLPEGASDEDADQEDAEQEDPDREDAADEEADEAPLEVVAEEGDPEADEERTHVYELARQCDESERIGSAARRSLDALLARVFGEPGGPSRPVTLLLTVAPSDRPGPRYEGPEGELVSELETLIRRVGGRTSVDVVSTGHAGGLRSLQRAIAGLKRDPSALYVIGAVDSLLALDTLTWLESAERLKSGTFGRHHGLAPAEAVGFVAVETETSARRGRRPLLATVGAVTLAQEPHPFVSDTPSRADGLTSACASALQEGGIGAHEIGTVLSDLDGEFHRAKEWALAEVRCLGEAGERALLHPADCFGSVGASSGVVLLVLAAIGLSRGWFAKPVLVVASDDVGECGAAILFPPRA